MELFRAAIPRLTVHVIYAQLLSWETVHLLDDGDWMRALLYAGVSFLGGLFLLKLGMRLAGRF